MDKDCEIPDSEKHDAVGGKIVSNSYTAREESCDYEDKGRIEKRNRTVGDYVLPTRGVVIFVCILR